MKDDFELKPLTTTPQQKKPKKPIVSIVSNIITFLLLAGISTLLHFLGVTSLMGLYLSIVCFFVFALVMIAGGFYIIIIPLHYISMFKAGSTRPDQSEKTTVTLIIISALLFILGFVVMLCV